jgi:superfamily II DNA or RNA helicase
LTPEASWPDFVRAAGQSDEGRRVLASWRRARGMLRLTEAKSSVLGRLLDRHVQNRVLVFAPDAETAIEISRRQLIPAITADIGRAERTRILERFSTGRLRALASARVLNEGVDVPAADVAVILGGSQGDRAYVQRVGRVLRPEPGKEAFIYELVVEGTGELGRLEQNRRALASA